MRGPGDISSDRSHSIKSVASGMYNVHIYVQCAIISVLSFSSMKDSVESIFIFWANK